MTPICVSFLTTVTRRASNPASNIFVIAVSSGMGRSVTQDVLWVSSTGRCLGTRGRVGFGVI